MTLPADDLLRAIRCLALDVDGVLTPGWIVYGPGGEWKVFDVHDGHGMRMWRRAGHRIGLISGRSSPAEDARADDLGVDYVAQGVRDKLDAYEEMKTALGVRDEEICAVGDDLPDLQLFRRAAVAVAVPEACDDVRTRAAWVTTRRGGCGAVREVIERILKAQGVWESLLNRYGGTSA